MVMWFVRVVMVLVFLFDASVTVYYLAVNPVGAVIMGPVAVLLGSAMVLEFREPSW